MERIDVPDLNIVGERYSSIDEFYRINEARPLNEHYDSDYDCGKDSTRKVKKGKSYTWDETRRDMLNGSDLFSEDFAKAYEEIERQVPKEWAGSERRGMRKDVVGQSISVERALAGHPKTFNRRIPLRLKQKTVSFFFSISCPHYTSTENRLKSGVMLMVICQHLERSGYQTRILYSPDFSAGKTGGASDPKTPSQIVQFTLKDFKTRFNLKKMQFPLASESALFHVGCWWNHRFPGTTFNWGYGEGYAVDNDVERLANAEEYARRQKAIYLSIPMVVNDFDMELIKMYEYVVKKIGDF